MLRRHCQRVDGGWAKIKNWNLFISFKCKVAFQNMYFSHLTVSVSDSLSFGKILKNSLIINKQGMNKLNIIFSSLFNFLVMILSL